MGPVFLMPAVATPAKTLMLILLICLSILARDTAHPAHPPHPPEEGASVRGFGEGGGGVASRKDFPNGVP